MLLDIHSPSGMNLQIFPDCQLFLALPSGQNISVKHKTYWNQTGRFPLNVLSTFMLPRLLNKQHSMNKIVLLGMRQKNSPFKVESASQDQSIWPAVIAVILLVMMTSDNSNEGDLSAVWQKGTFVSQSVLISCKRTWRVAAAFFQKKKELKECKESKECPGRERTFFPPPGNLLVAPRQLFSLMRLWTE